MRLFCLFLLACVVFPGCSPPPAPEPSPTEAQTLTGARAGFQTKIESQPNWPPTAAPEPPAEIFKLVKYPSEVGELAAYVTPDPGDGKRHPAVVWCHGGFGGIDAWFWEQPDPENDQTAAAFREAGLILMLPSWRGENDNPGQFELFYGEVNDVVRALKYTRELPYVDPDRVYLAGHSTGGTLVLLAAESTDQFRAAFSFGGAPDVARVVLDGEGYGNTPFDYRFRRESQLRSAINFVGDIKRPTYYFEGEDSYGAEALAMAKEAQKLGVPFQAQVVTGTDHFSILYPLTRLVAEKILKDEGVKPSFSFPEAEVQARLR